MNTQFINTNGGTIAYDQSGEGRLVVCVPGMGDVRAEYRLLAPRLVSAGYKVITMDLRGHGESSPDWNDYSVAGVGQDILALIREMKDGPAVIVGTSMAAGAAVWAAAEGSDLTAGIALIDPVVRGETNQILRLVVSALFQRPWGPAFWKAYYASLYPTRKPADFPAYTRALQANLKQKGRMEALLQMMLASQSASEARLGRVKAPALVMMGSRDSEFKNPQAEAAAVAGFLKASWHMIPDAGHYPHVEQVGAATEILLPFLEEVTHAA